MRAKLSVLDSSIGQGHELIQHSEFQLELDRVDHGLERRLDLIVVFILHRQQDNVEGNDDDVDPDQMGHDLARPAMIDGLQEFERRPDVQAGDDEFLTTKGRHLRTLHDVEAVDESGRQGVVLRSIRTKGEDRRGNVEEESVQTDHGQDATQNPRIADDQMQSRVEHDGLSRHHGIPANGDEADGQVNVGQVEELENEAEGVDDDAPRRNQKGPEVEASMSFEGQEDLQIQLNHIEPGDGGEGGDGHVGGRARIDATVDARVRWILGRGGHDGRRFAKAQPVLTLRLLTAASR